MLLCSGGACDVLENKVVMKRSEGTSDVSAFKVQPMKCTYGTRLNTEEQSNA
jgi:hypothetical protein